MNQRVHILIMPEQLNHLETSGAVKNKEQQITQADMLKEHALGQLDQVSEIASEGVTEEVRKASSEDTASSGSATTGTAAAQQSSEQTTTTVRVPEDKQVLQTAIKHKINETIEHIDDKISQQKKTKGSSQTLQALISERRDYTIMLRDLAHMVLEKLKALYEQLFSVTK